MHKLSVGVGLLLSMMLSGCAGSFGSMFESAEAKAPVTSGSAQSSQMANTDNGIRYRAERKDHMQRQQDSELAQWLQYKTPKNLYQPQYTHKSLADYAEQLSMQLIENAHNLSVDSRIGVASFVHFDASLQRATALGNQLSEMMISQVQQYGLSVVDFKAMGSVQVDRYGDFVFSRDTRRLASNVAMDYVLSGTLVENEKGVTVNARILSMHSKVLVASASIHIPHFIVQQIQPNVQVLTQAP